MNSLSQILLFLTAARMIVASPVVAALGSTKGNVINDTSGIESAKELGKNMVKIAKLTETLRKN